MALQVGLDVPESCKEQPEKFTFGAEGDVPRGDASDSMIDPSSSIPPSILSCLLLYLSWFHEAPHEFLCPCSTFAAP